MCVKCLNSLCESIPRRYQLFNSGSIIFYFIFHKLENVTFCINSGEFILQGRGECNRQSLAGIIINVNINLHSTDFIFNWIIQQNW